MRFGYRVVDQIDEVGNRLARFVLVPRDVISSHDWTCCDERSSALEAQEVIAEETALIPISHWLEHELAEASSGQLADILISSSFRAGALRPDSTYPRYDRVDIEMSTQRRQIAISLLEQRGTSREQITAIEAGQYWPES